MLAQGLAAKTHASGQCLEEELWQVLQDSLRFCLEKSPANFLIKLCT